MQDPDSGVSPALLLTDCTTLTIRPRKGDTHLPALLQTWLQPCPFLPPGWGRGPTMTTSTCSHSLYLWCPQAPESGGQDRTNPQARHGLRNQGRWPLPLTTHPLTQPSVPVFFHLSHHLPHTNRHQTQEKLPPKLPSISSGFPVPMTSIVVESLRHVQLFTIPWITGRQAPLSMGFPRQEY